LSFGYLVLYTILLTIIGMFTNTLEITSQVNGLLLVYWIVGFFVNCSNN
jgi:hypothetical protein